LECGDVTPLSFVSLFFETAHETRETEKPKESGVTSPHSKSENTDTEPIMLCHITRRLVALLAVWTLSASAAAKEPKPSTYPFARPPLEIYEALPDLKVGDVPSISADERKVLQSAWELRSKGEAKVPDRLLLDALLFASGIEEAAKRDAYRERFEKLVADARDAVKGAKDDRDKGEKIMKFLHGGVMKNKYDADQSSFADIFDSGKFNCVSSSAMYYAVGTRLGLELRPISIPGGVLAGHASLDLVDGKDRVQVEPTNPNGFDWAAKIKKPGVTVIGFVPDRKQGYEVDALGLPAMIYSNRGVPLSKDKSDKQLEALRCYISALACDPTDKTSINNFQSVFVNWGPKLADAKKFEEGIRVMGFAQSLAPKVRDIENNHKVVWQKYIVWLLDNQRDAEAVAVVKRAATAVPGEADFRSASRWLEQAGAKHVKAEDWDAALAVVERGLKVLEGDEARKMKAWRSSVFRQWSQSLLKKKDADGSMKVLARAYALDPSDKEIHEGVEYHAQEALPMIEAKVGREAMVKHFQALRAQFPQVKKLADKGKGHAQRAVHELGKAKKFAEAVAAASDYAPLLGSAADRADVGAYAYDLWARDFADKKEWQTALDKYSEGLKTYPKHDMLVGNLRYTVGQWAKPAVDKKDWAEAARIYRIGLTYLPKDPRLEQNLKAYEQRAKK
jgi:tetratricopeptide (TPR) repeat protein